MEKGQKRLGGQARSARREANQPPEHVRWAEWAFSEPQVMLASAPKEGAEPQTTSPDGE